MAGPFGYNGIMPIVRMLFDMQGLRYDGQPWPGFHGTIEVPEWEAEAMIADKVAESADEPMLNRGYDVLRAPSADYEENLERVDGQPRSEEDDLRPAHLVPVDEAEDTWDDDDDFDRDDVPEEPVTPEVKRPYTNAAKSEWINYAITQGAKRTEISEMTKAMLIDLYG